MCWIMNMLRIIKKKKSTQCWIIVSCLCESLLGVIFWLLGLSPSHLLRLSVPLPVVFGGGVKGLTNWDCTLFVCECVCCKIPLQNMSVWHSDEEWGVLTKHKSCSLEPQGFSLFCLCVERKSSCSFVQKSFCLFCHLPSCHSMLLWMFLFPSCFLCSHWRGKSKTEASVSNNVWIKSDML